MGRSSKRMSPVGGLLVDATSDRPVSAVKPDCLRRHADALVQAATMHRVPGPLAAAFGRGGVDVPAELSAQQQRDAIARMTTLHDIEFLASTFSSIGVPYLVFKGQVLTTLVGRNEWERPSLDLDVLVPVEDMERAVAALVDVGSIPLDRNWELMREQMIGEMHLMLPSGTSLDLHWHLLVNESMRSDFTPGHDDLFRTSRTVDLDGTAVPTFGSSETLVYSCLHAAISGGHRLVWLKDLERLVNFDQPDWGDVIEVARRWRCSNVTGAMLARSQRSLGLDLPAGLLDALVTSRVLRRCFDWIDRRHPVEENLRDESFLRLATRSIGPDAGSTLRRFLSRSGAFALGRARHLDALSPTALFEVAGSTDDRNEYFHELNRRSL